jgi:hypothetical protein
MIRIAFVLSILLLTACATSGDRSTAGAEVPAAHNAKVAGGAEPVCVKEAVTGSRHPKLVCYSAQEWRAMRDSAQNATRDIQRLPRLPREGD